MAAVMFTLRKHFNLHLPMVPCDQCGNTAQTTFSIDAVVTARELCPAGYIIDNGLITDESLRRYFDAAPLWQGSCEQLTAMIGQWLASHCGDRVVSVDVAVENRDIPPPANSRITYHWTPGCNCPTLTPIYDPGTVDRLCSLGVLA
jgi:hypothetical protein